MPRTKKIEKEEEMEIDAKKQKKETFVTRWFKDYAVNNSEELKIICDLTSRSAQDQFSLYLRSNNTEVYAVVFYATFLTILDFLKEREKKHNNFSIVIANSINIGYTNNNNEDNEKIGNFMPIMEYLGINRNIVDDSTNTDPNKTVQNFMQWKELNTKKNVEYYKEIQERTYDRLMKEYHTSIRTSEAVIPLFCTFMDNIGSVLKMKYKEAEGTDVSEVSMNVLGLFDIYYSFDEDENKEIIEFQPNIMMKLRLKSDAIASGGQ